MAPRKKVILIDSKSLQAMQHLLGTGEPRRLTSFLAALVSIGNVEIRFSGGLPFNGAYYTEPMRRMLRRFAKSLPRLFSLFCHDLNANELADCDLLIITTRWRPTPYSNREIRAIKEFIEQGGSLWLMANHSRVPGTRMGDFTTQDSRLAAALGMELLEGCFQMPEGFCELSCPTDLRNPIPGPNKTAFRRMTLCINNTALVSTRGVHPLVFPRNDMIDRGPHGLSVSGHVFAATKSLGEGRVILTGDSGFIGEPNVVGSGPGLIAKGQNARFVVVAITWLLGSG